MAASQHFGDDGFTGYLGEGRLAKHDPRIEAHGALDEANAALGLARSACQRPSSRELVIRLQRDLYGMMSEVAAAPENAARFRKIDVQRVAWLDEATRQVEETNPSLGEFILPGDTPAGAAFDLARTVVRRAERRVSELVHAGQLDNSEILRYLNRLSTLCFDLELAETAAEIRGGPTLARSDDQA